MKNTRRILVLALVLCMLVQMLPVAAFECETPEATSEAASAPEANLNEDTIPGFPTTTLDDTMGRLVAFWNFEGTDPGKASYADASVNQSAFIWLYQEKADVSHTLDNTVAGFENLNSTAWNIRSADTTVFEIPAAPPAGKYSVRMKVLTKTGGTVGYPILQGDGFPSKADLFMQTAAASKQGEYVTAATTFPTTQSTRYLYLRNYNANGNTNEFAIDDFEIWSYPANAFILRPTSDSTDGEMVTVTEETYTFPSTYGENAVELWTDGFVTYKAGQTVDAALLYGNTFYPGSDTVVSLYNATYGQLIFFTDFKKNATDADAVANRIEAYSPVKNLRIPSFAYNGLAEIGGKTALPAKDKSFDGKASNYLGVTVASGDSKEWTYAGTDTLVSGTVYLISDYYFDVDTPSGYSLLRSNGGADAWDLISSSSAVRSWGTSKGNGVKITNGKISYLSLGWCGSEANNLSFTNIRVYVKPDNALWLTSDASGSNRTFVPITGDTYTFPTTFNGESVASWTNGTTVWAAGSTAAKADIAAKTVYPIKRAAAPAEYDETYGQLVWVNDFSGSNDFANLADIKIVTYKYEENNKIFDGYTVLKCGQSDLSPNPVGLEVTPTDGSAWKYANGLPMSGTLSLYTELYVDYDSLPDRFSVAAPGSGWGAYDTTWNLAQNTLQPKAWGIARTHSYSLGQYTRIGELSNNWRTEYCRMLAVYVKPDNALWLTSDHLGSNRSYNILSGDTYTFPTEYNGETVSKWTDGTTVWAAGSTAAKADIAAKTVYPLKSVSTPAEYDETYGQLIWFDNFSGDTGFTNLADLKIASFIDTTPRAVEGYMALPAKKATFNHHWIEIERNGDTWHYTDNKALSGSITVCADIYNNLDKNGGLNTVARADGDDDGNGTQCSRHGKGYNNNKAWQHWGIYDTPWGVKAPTDSALQPKTWTKTYMWPVKIESADIRYGFNIFSTEDAFYARSVAVYIKPDNALWLVDADGENRAFEVAASDTYTFPTVFNGVNVRSWKNGEITYTAGAEANVSAIAGKTWTVDQTADVGLSDTVSVRTSGNAGIRYRASIDLATRANLTEFGFMATRDKHFNEQFGTSDDSFTLANDKTNNSKYCTVVRKASSEISRYMEEIDGNAFFNAVVTGVPTKKATLTENIHLRSFVVCGGITYYSAVKTDSIYNAAKKIAESHPEYAEDAYIKGIIDTCEK